MKLKDLFLADLEREIPPTRRALERVPDGFVHRDRQRVHGCGGRTSREIKADRDRGRGHRCPA
jgi:hypothetical protein